MTSAKLLPYLQTETLADRATELHLTALRSEWLRQFVAGSPPDDALLEAFAGFARCCEYVFAESEEDRALLARLDERDPHDRPMIECFRQLRIERWPVEDIQSFSEIDHPDTAKLVAHYEENPYPRYQTIRPHPPTDESGEFLIAGCGTGREALGIAMMHPNARVTAIDLSRQSLAYGLAKARAHGVRNVGFIQGDLMKVGNLGRKFDRIWSSGVLHHQESPTAGLRALENVLVPGGEINLSVYSRVARTPALAGKELAKKLGVTPTREGLHWFRGLIFQLPKNHPAHFLYTASDFYSLSGVRDLCFNPIETVFSVKEAAAFVTSSGLRLIRFGAGRKPERRFHEMGFTDVSDLEAWQATENRFPGTFSDMYRMIAGHHEPRRGGVSRLEGDGVI